jgi:hypothetical protein
MTAHGRFGCLAVALAFAANLLVACGGGSGTDATRSSAGADAGGGASPVRFHVTVKNVSTSTTATTSTGAPLPVVFGPGAYAVHAAGVDWFDAGNAATPDLEHLAEDGNPTDAIAALKARSGFTAGAFGADRIGVSYGDAAIEPGGSADFRVHAAPGDRLDFGMMWSQSNDVFVATDPGGLPLFDGTAPRLGPVTTGISLWDAGTEVNQEPGLGDAQGPRQPSPGYGTKEDGVITRLDGDKDASGYSYPSLATTLDVTLALD